MPGAGAGHERARRDVDTDITVEAIVIARIWRGWTRTKDAAAYIEYLHQTGMKDYRRTPGNTAAYILHMTIGDRTEFVTLTFWDSIEAVKAFAGEQYENAVFYDEDDRYLVDRENTTGNYQVIAAAE